MKIALQLWTVRALAERDMLATLRAVAAIGYRAVEFAGLGDTNVADIRRTLDELQITAVSAHVALADLTKRLPRVIAQIHALDCRQVVLPWIPAEYRAPLDQAMRLATTCNAIGAALAREGITFAYHNEDYDFLPLQTTTLWHALVAATDPALVNLQLDLFTTQCMHINVSALMREHGPRISSLHLCDERDGRYVPIGTGTCDWPPLIAAARATASQWLIVEQDGSQQPIEDARTNLEQLRALTL